MQGNQEARLRLSLARQRRNQGRAEAVAGSAPGAIVCFEIAAKEALRAILAYEDHHGAYPDELDVLIGLANGSGVRVPPGVDAASGPAVDSAGIGADAAIDLAEATIGAHP